LAQVTRRRGSTICDFALCRVYGEAMSDPISRSAEAQNIMRHLLHEMRTPLGQIIGYGEMLEEEMADRGLAELAGDTQRIQAAAHKLLRLLEHVFQTGPEVATYMARSSAAETEATAAVGSGSSSGAAAGRLLLVDDDAENRGLLLRRLTKAGYAVTAVGDGANALRQVESGDFELVLLDVLMPGLSGIEVLASIRRTRSASDLPVIMVTALGGSEDTVAALRGGANDYVSKPFDMTVVLARVENQLALKRSTAEIQALARQLEIRNGFIRRAFGRYISDEVVDDLLERPEGLELRGEKRRVTILVCDLRGFSTLTESLEPAQVVLLLNGFLGRMAEIVQSHGGTVDEFLGDAVLAFFGAPASRGADAEHAVAAAVAMQLAMEEVNRANRESGLPEVEMGIGIATGDVIVGNVGSERRTKYTAVGSSVNLASRIESFTLGGDILICDATFAATQKIVRADPPRAVHPKGLDAPIFVRRVRGVGGTHDLDLPDVDAEWKILANEVPVRFELLEGKQVSGGARRGSFCALSQSGARLRSNEALSEMADLRIEIVDGSGAALQGAFYAKVVGVAPEPDRTFLLRFTSRSPALEQTLARAQGE
jgi:class 3 adenylate cyclase